MIKLYGHSTALYSTWFFIENYGLLFDAGDGMLSALQGKAGKIKHCFVSHADRDHLAGLLAYQQLFAKQKPSIYFPKDAGSFPALASFSQQFDPHVKGTQWQAIAGDASISIGPNLKIHTKENTHIHVPGKCKSLSFQLVEEKKKLKEAYIGLSAVEIQQLKKEKGEEALFNRLERKILSYSGDTGICNEDFYQNSEILIHEATFLTEKECQEKNSKNKHSALESVLKMVKGLTIDRLVLSHFSSRYKQREIDAAIGHFAQKFGVDIPIYRVPLQYDNRLLLGRKNQIQY